MDSTVAELILAEMRGLRSELGEFRVEVHEWQQATGERVATLETQVKTGITGNGQPSRLAVVEKSVQSLQWMRAKVIGIAVGVSGTVSVIGWIITRLMH